MTPVVYSPGLLPAVVRFWNRAFASKRNFFPVTEDLFRRRVVGNRRGAERFDPTGLILAREAGEIVGMIHVGVRSEALCRALEPSWPGGRQGVVYFLYVEPSCRRRGIGAELWNRGLERLKSARPVLLDGECRNPFYGNSDGPFTPFWGTPNGVGVDRADSATQKFLARKGYAPRFRAIHMAIDLDAARPRSPEEEVKALRRLGFELSFLTREVPQVGGSASERWPVRAGLDYESVYVTRGGRTVGAVVCYPLKEVRAGLYGIYQANVVKALRGKALGRHLLNASLARMQAHGATSCEVVTVPDLAPAAWKLYQSLGFQQVAAWAVY